MRLELGKINISDVQFGAATEVRDGVLYVNREEVQALILEDERIVKADIELARPGEEVPHHTSQGRHRAQSEGIRLRPGVPRHG